jgi:hypothetical protein
MKNSSSWAVTVGITVVASFVLAVQDPSYRPAFVQVAMLTMLTPSRVDKLYNNDHEADDPDSDLTKRKEYERSQKEDSHERGDRDS